MKQALTVGYVSNISKLPHLFFVSAQHGQGFRQTHLLRTCNVFATRAQAKNTRAAPPSTSGITYSTLPLSSLCTCTTTMYHAWQPKLSQFTRATLHIHV